MHPVSRGKLRLSAEAHSLTQGRLEVDILTISCRVNALVSAPPTRQAADIGEVDTSEPASSGRPKKEWWLENSGTRGLGTE